MKTVDLRRYPYKGTLIEAGIRLGEPGKPKSRQAVRNLLDRNNETAKRTVNAIVAERTAKLQQKTGGGSR